MTGTVLLRLARVKRQSRAYHDLALLLPEFLELYLFASAEMIK